MSAAAPMPKIADRLYADAIAHAVQLRPEGSCLGFSTWRAISFLFEATDTLFASWYQRMGRSEIPPSYQTQAILILIGLLQGVLLLPGFQGQELGQLQVLTRFPQQLGDDDVSASFLTALNLKRGAGGVVETEYRSCSLGSNVYTEAECIALLSDIRQLTEMPGSAPRKSMILTNLRHAIALTYDHTMQIWQVWDTRETEPASFRDEVSLCASTAFTKMRPNPTEPYYHLIFILLELKSDPDSSATLLEKWRCTDPREKTSRLPGLDMTCWFHLTIMNAEIPHYHTLLANDPRLIYASFSKQDSFIRRFPIETAYHHRQLGLFEDLCMRMGDAPLPPEVSQLTYSICLAEDLPYIQIFLRFQRPTIEACAKDFLHDYPTHETSSPEEYPRSQDRSPEKIAAALKALLVAGVSPFILDGKTSLLDFAIQHPETGLIFPCLCSPHVDPLAIPYEAKQAIIDWFKTTATPDEKAAFSTMLADPAHHIHRFFYERKKWTVGTLPDPEKGHLKEILTLSSASSSGTIAPQNTSELIK